MTDEFFIIFLATILITRIFLLVKPVAAPTIGGFRMHHWMYGLAGIAIAFVVRLVIIYAIGLGLFIDELTYLTVSGKTHEDNYSFLSLTGTTVLIVLVFLLRRYLISPFS